MKHWGLGIAVFVILTARMAQAVTIDMVTVGNAGNVADPDTGYGSVIYDYRIAKFDVTAAQYCEFLNSVAKVSDPYGLYNINMDMAQRKQGCNILRTGPAGNYNYSVASDWANRPVNYVSWGDAARFCNWLENGQKTGNEGVASLEYGTYALSGVNTDAALMAVTRSADAKYFIPTLNEWFKAAYFDPNKNGTGAAGYWVFPTKNDSTPSNVLDPAGTNNANFYVSGSTHDYTIGGPYYRTEVGAFVASPSAYGTYDQGGNVGQWNETANILSRGANGGSFSGFYGHLAKSTGSGTYPTQEGSDGGFRVASLNVPEPSIFMMLLLGSAAGVFWRRRRCKAF